MKAFQQAFLLTAYPHFCQLFELVSTKPLPRAGASSFMALCHDAKVPGGAKELPEFETCGKGLD